MCYPHNKISIDEGMIPFKGRLKFKQRMPLKPAKVGIKMFVCPNFSLGTATSFKSILAKKMTKQMVVNCEKLVLLLFDF